MKRTLLQFYYSFVVQLFILHLQKSTALLGVWLILALGISGTLGESYGIKFLFLDPEYMGGVRFRSFFLMGVAFGGFLMVWNLVSYMLHSFRFAFLAALTRPFLKFSINNALLPFSFLIFYLIQIIRFQAYNEYAESYSIFYYIFGFLSGLILMLTIIVFYFLSTNKNIFKYIRKKSDRPPAPSKPLSSRRNVYKVSPLTTWRVDFYWNERLRIRRTRDVQHYSPEILLQVFRQNHYNAFFFQMMSFLSLILFAYLMDNPYFRIPAGASIFLLATMFVSVIGAIKYWFKTWRVLAFIIIIVLINIFTALVPVQYKNKVGGMNYDTQKAVYQEDSLAVIASFANFKKDTAQTIRILNNWKNKQPFTGDLPKMVIVSVSGGGLRATAWTTLVLQQLDSLTEGQIFNQAALFTGASGGMLGAAYMRDVFLASQKNPEIRVNDATHFTRMASDLQNSVAFAIAVNDIFVPWIPYRMEGYKFYKDRGYIFERQLLENSGGLLNKKITDYQAAEAKAQIPMLFITPTVANDLRKLIISPQPVSYMMRPTYGFQSDSLMEIDGVDFRQFFAQQEADNLLMTTALRMSATYPFILPNVTLPTEPSVESVDAGWRDNYGFETALRFTNVFQNWIETNTSGVVLIQIRGDEKQKEVKPSNSGFISEWFNALGALGQMFDKQDFNSDNQINNLKEKLGEDKVSVFQLEYVPSQQNQAASMSFHLTKREQQDIKQAIFSNKNQKTLRQLRQLMAE